MSRLSGHQAGSNGSIWTTKPLPISQRPGSIISMDLMNLPTSQDDSGNTYDVLYVICCTLSKMVHLVPTTKNVTAQQAARLYYENIYRLHGLPKSIISDRDTRSACDFWSTLQKLFGTDLLMSMAYHPQTDGQTERTNRTILQTLRNYVNGSNWLNSSSPPNLPSTPLSVHPPARPPSKLFMDIFLNFTAGNL
jgi:hypothetical protein